MKNQRLASEILAEVDRFLQQQKSIMIAVKDTAGEPLASYAPFARVGECLYILVSELAKHTQALFVSDVASVLLVADEAATEQIYARQRLQYEMSVSPVVRGSDSWQLAFSALAERHGEIVEQLGQLADFHMFAFTPLSGRYVKGFGRAYELSQHSLVGKDLDHLTR